MSTSAAQPYFLIDMIEVRKDLMQDFIVNMTLLVPVFEGYGWKLISATYTLTGQPSTVMHVWQIPTADSLRNTMVKMSENTLYLKLQQTIRSEQQNILSRMPYDPVEIARPKPVAAQPAPSEAEKGAPPDEAPLETISSSPVAPRTAPASPPVAASAPVAPPASAPAAPATAAPFAEQPEAVEAEIEEARVPGDRAREILKDFLDHILPK